MVRELVAVCGVVAVDGVLAAVTVGGTVCGAVAGASAGGTFAARVSRAGKGRCS